MQTQQFATRRLFTSSNNKGKWLRNDRYKFKLINAKSKSGYHRKARQNDSVNSESTDDNNNNITQTSLQQNQKTNVIDTISEEEFDFQQEQEFFDMGERYQYDDDSYIVRGYGSWLEAVDDTIQIQGEEEDDQEEYLMEEDKYPESAGAQRQQIHEKPLYMRYRVWRPEWFWETSEFLRNIKDMKTSQEILAKMVVQIKKHKKLTADEVAGVCSMVIEIGDNCDPFQREQKLFAKDPNWKIFFQQVDTNMKEMDILGLLDSFTVCRFHENPAQFQQNIIKYLSQNEEKIKEALTPRLLSVLMYQLSSMLRNKGKLFYPKNLLQTIINTVNQRLDKFNALEVHALWRLVYAIQKSGQKDAKLDFFEQLVDRTVEVADQMDIFMISWTCVVLCPKYCPKKIFQVFEDRIKSELQIVQFPPGPIFRILWAYVTAQYPLEPNFIVKLVNLACNRKGFVMDEDLSRMAFAMSRLKLKNAELAHWLAREITYPYRACHLPLSIILEVVRYIQLNEYFNPKIIKVLHKRIKKHVDVMDLPLLVNSFNVYAKEDAMQKRQIGLDDKNAQRVHQESNNVTNADGSNFQDQREDLIDRMTKIILDNFEHMPVDKCWAVMDVIGNIDKQPILKQASKKFLKHSCVKKYTTLSPADIGITLRIMTKYNIYPQPTWLKAVEDMVIGNLGNYYYQNVIDIANIWQRMGEKQWSANLLLRLLNTSLPSTHSSLVYIFRISNCLSDESLNITLYERSMEWMKIAPVTSVKKFIEQMLQSDIRSIRRFAAAWIEQFGTLERERSIQIFRNILNTDHERSRTLVEVMIQVMDPKLLTTFSTEDMQWVAQQVIKSAGPTLRYEWYDGLRLAIKKDPRQWKTSTIIELVTALATIEQAGDALSEITEILLHDKLLELSAGQLCALHQVAKDIHDNSLIGTVERRFVAWIRAVPPEHYDYLNYHLVESKIDCVQIWEAFALQIIYSLEGMDQAQLSWLLWGMVKAGYVPTKLFMRKFDVAVEQKLNGLDFGGLATIMWCYGKILYKQPQIFEQIGQAAVVRGQAYNQEVTIKRISILTWAFAELDHQPEGYLHWAYTQIERLLPEDPQSASAVITFLWASYMLQYQHIHPHLVSQVVDIIQTELSSLYDDELANIAYMCAKWRVQLSNPDRWHHALIQEVSKRVINLECTHLAQLLWVFAETGREIPKHLVRRMTERAEANVFGAGDNNVINIIWSFLQLDSKPYALIGQWCKYVNENILKLDMESLAATVWIMGELEIFMITPSQKQLLAHILQQLNLRRYELTPQGVTRLLSGLIRLKHEDESVIKMLLNELINFGNDVPLDDYVEIYKLMSEYKIELPRATFVEVLNAVVWQPPERIQLDLSTQGLTDVIEIMSENFKKEYVNQLLLWEPELCSRVEAREFDWGNLATVLSSFAKNRIDPQSLIEKVQQFAESNPPQISSWKHVGNLLWGITELSRAPGKAVFDVLYTSIKKMKYLDGYAPEYCTQVLWAGMVSGEYDHPAVLHTAKFLAERLKPFDIQELPEVKRKLSQVLLVAGAEEHADLLAQLDSDVKVMCLQEWISYQEQLSQQGESPWLLKTARALRNMQIVNEERKLIQNGGLFCQLHIPGSSPPVVFEIYSQSNVTRNSQRLIANMLIRQRLFHAWGYRIVTFMGSEVESMSVDDLEIVLQGKLGSYEFNKSYVENVV